MTSLIVALDAPLERSIEIYRVLRLTGCAFKVGVPFLLEQFGRQVAGEIVQNGHRLMVDIKLYDTKDTVLRTIEAVERLGAHMVTVHEDCVVHAAQVRGVAAVLAVGMLTDGTAGSGFARPEGADGIVCSVSHAAVVRQYHDKLIVCPGIRPDGSPANNHTLAATPRQARDAGADYIIVGRPIIDAADPVAVVRAIMEEIEG